MDPDRSPTAGRGALLVEDDALVAMVAEEYLRELGFEPVTARSAAEALRMIESRPGLAVALIDVGLPDRPGDELAKQLRQLRPEMPILMASGYDRKELLSRFDGDPAIGALAKPYSEAELTRALDVLDVKPSAA